MRKYILILLTIPLLLVSCDGFKILEEQDYEIARNGYPGFVNDDFEQHDGRFSTRNRYVTDGFANITDSESHSGEYSVCLGNFSPGSFRITVNIPTPSTFSFWGQKYKYNSSYISIDDFFTVMVDYEKVEFDFEPSSPGNWILFQFEVPAGEHTIIFQNTSSSARIYIDDLFCRGTVLSPEYDELVIDGMPLLDWFEEPLALSYNIQISRDADFSNPVLDLSGLKDSFYQIDAPLAGNTRYYWRIKRNSEEPANDKWSSPWCFRVPGVFISDGFESGDFSGSIWIAEGNILPEIVKEETYEGEYYVVLGKDSNKGKSSISTSFIATEKSYLKFWMGSKGSYSEILMYLNDEEVEKKQIGSGLYLVDCEPGLNTVRWEFDKHSFSDRAYLDSVELLPISSLLYSNENETFDDGTIDFPLYTFTGLPTPVVTADAAFEGGYGLEMGGGERYCDVYFNVFVYFEKPKVITFNYNLNNSEGTFEFYIDNDEVLSFHKDLSTWQKGVAVCSEGFHKLSWKSDKYYTNNSPMFLDSIRVSDIRPFSGDNFESGDFSANGWILSEISVPEIQGTVTHNNSYGAVRFLYPGHLEKSSLYMPVYLESPATVDFSIMKVDRFSDYFSLIINGDRTDLDSPDNTWADYSMVLPAGVNLLEWRYYSWYSDHFKFYLDDIVIK